MRYRYFREMEGDDAEYYGGTLIGMTVGCGCCSENEAVTPELMDRHIESLETALEEAKKLRERLA